MSEKSFLRRPEPAAGSSRDGLLFDDPDFRVPYPAIWEYLTSTAWPDGSPRERASLLLVIEDGTWKGCVNDREHQRSLWRSGESLADLLEQLEQGLQRNVGDWRRARPKGKGQR